MSTRSNPQFHPYFLKHYILMASTVTPGAVACFYGSFYGAFVVNDVAPSSGENITDLLQ